MSRVSRLLVIVLLLVVVAAGGCRKRQAKTSPEAPAAPPESAAQASPPPADANPGRAIQSVGTRPTYATPEDIAAYNKALYEYCYRVSDIPTDLNDLKGRRGLPPLPVPPPGRRLTYRPDLKNMEIKTAVIRLE